MSRTPSYEYEVLHQFEAIFRDGEHRTRAATRDYQKVWENVIDNPPEEGVTPVFVYRMNGETCAATAGQDDLVSNEECAMELARLAARVAELEAENAKLRACLEAADACITKTGRTNTNWDELAAYKAARAGVDK